MVKPILGETINEYKTLSEDPVTRQTWTTSFGKDFVNLSQVNKKTRTAGTDSMFVLEKYQIKTIPEY